MTDYDLLAAQTSALIRGVPHLVADLANISALIYHSLEDINWVGFYLIEDGRLVLGPFQGNTACVEIPLGKGVCGTAAAEDRTVLVPDVHLFAGHIACDSASRSEIVIPVHINGRLIGVLDIDSPLFSRFTAHDAEGLEEFARILERVI